MEANIKIPFKKRFRVQAANICYRLKRLRPQIDKGFRVLLYHSITDDFIENEWEEKTTPKSLFDKQMRYLADNKYSIISCKQGVEYLATHQKIPNKAIAISFDDGYKDNYLNALPVLKKYNFCATVFITIDFLRDYSDNSQTLSFAEIADMKKSGVMDFGCHGLSHKALTTLDRLELDKEVGEAKQKLEGIIKEKVELFAYPFGHIGSYDKSVIKTVKSAGFLGAFTSVFGLNNSEINPFLIRRNRISWLDGPSEFEKHLSGAYDWYVLWQFFGYKRY